jgi:hypothetical protein
MEQAQAVAGLERGWDSWMLEALRAESSAELRPVAGLLTSLQEPALSAPAAQRLLPESRRVAPPAGAVQPGLEAAEVA